MIVAAIAALYLIVEGVAKTLWLGPSAELTEKLEDVDGRLKKAHRILARGKQIKTEWAAILRRFDQPRLPDVPNQFLTHLDGLCSGAGLDPDIQSSPSRQKGELKEYTYGVRTDLTTRGHALEVIHGWTAVFGGAQMIQVDPVSGTLTAAADPRRRTRPAR